MPKEIQVIDLVSDDEDTTVSIKVESNPVLAHPGVSPNDNNLTSAMQQGQKKQQEPARDDIDKDLLKQEADTVALQSVPSFHLGTTAIPLTLEPHSVHCQPQTSPLANTSSVSVKQELAYAIPWSAGPSLDVKTATVKQEPDIPQVEVTIPIAFIKQEMASDTQEAGRFSLSDLPMAPLTQATGCLLQEPLSGTNVQTGTDLGGTKEAADAPLENVHHTAELDKLFKQREVLLGLQQEELFSEDLAKKLADVEKQIEELTHGPVSGESNAKSVAPPPAGQTRKSRKRFKTAGDYWADHYSKRPPFEPKSGIPWSAASDTDGVNLRHKGKRKGFEAAMGLTESVDPPGSGKKQKTRQKKAGDDDVIEFSTGLDIASLLEESSVSKERKRFCTLAGAELIKTTDKAKQLRAIFKRPSHASDGKQYELDKQKFDRVPYTFGHGKCRAKDGKWELDGMNCLLESYQLLGVSWMLSREFDPEGPPGGILADAPGLGKTIMSLACMSGNTPSDKDIKAGYRLTLIIVPTNALTQWKAEIEKHTSFLKKVHIYESKQKISQACFGDWDVLLISYNELVSAVPTKSRYAAIMKAKMKQEGGDASGNEVPWQTQLENARGDILKIKFFRIILDEGHEAKNSESQRAQACSEVEAKHRWILSATPIQNGIKEAYSYLKVLYADKEMTLKVFNSTLGNTRNPRAIKQLQDILSKIVRKTCKGESFLGKKLINVPAPSDKSDMPHFIHLSDEENVIYEMLKGVFKARLEDGGNKRSDNVLKLITNLRQAVSHPYLTCTALEKDFNYADLLQLSEKLENLPAPSPFLTRHRAWLERLIKKRHYTHTYRGSRDSSSDIEEEDDKDSDYQDGTEKRATSVGTAMSRSSMTPSKGHSRGKGSRTAGRGVARGNRYHVRERRPGDDVHNIHPKVQSSLIQDCWPTGPIESSKTTAVREIIQKSLKDNPEDKIIVFTIYLETAFIIGHMLQQENIGFVYYNGQLNNRDDKDNQIEAFKENSEVKVLISSLQCGGQSLNLTIANHVILVDPWWNSSAEEQAFGRVWRYGQTKVALLTRLHAQDTIDERMAELQQKKRESIEEILKKPESLTNEDIDYLVG